LPGLPPFRVAFEMRAYASFEIIFNWWTLKSRKVQSRFTSWITPSISQIQSAWRATICPCLNKKLSNLRFDLCESRITNQKKPNAAQIWRNVSAESILRVSTLKRVNFTTSPLTNFQYLQLLRILSRRVTSKWQLFVKSNNQIEPRAQNVRGASQLYLILWLYHPKRIRYKKGLHSSKWWDARANSWGGCPVVSFLLLLLPAGVRQP